jgi:serine/threonine protein kinase/Tol biopolymer transport system component
LFYNSSELMPISIGTQLGSHEITALLGKGGMGEVYRARDLKLKREVAIKILPDEFSRDADRVSRFQREAEVLASLNHPNIAAIYDLQEANETRYLILELVEGETLADRIARGPIPVEQALEIAKRICEALEAAHEKGIIHRDLKPANVKLTDDGKVKVLDFGLAKAIEKVPTNSTLSNSPTLSIAASGAGVILGTAAYMSPEQARGESTDARTDVFSFGCVLYEMLSGHQAFDGNTVSDILAGILRVEPNFTALPKNLSPRVVEILQRSLEKNAKRRWHAVADLKMELEVAGADAYNPPQTSPVSRSSKVWMTLGAVSLFAAIAMAAVLVFNYRVPRESQMVRFLISPPDKTTFDTGLGGGVGGLTSLSAGSISPDGRKIAFTARDEAGKIMLWVRPLDTIAARVLPGTEGAGLPFWSPDSKSIAFFSLGKLKKIDVEGGPTLTICDAVNPRGGTWNRDGVILVVPASLQSAVFRVPAAGGEPTVVTKHTGAGFPFFLPDGKHFLFTTTTGDRTVFVGSLDSADARRLMAADSAAVYASSGYILFVRQGTLLAQQFDPRKLELTGEAVPIAEQLAFETPAPSFSVSETGTLTYRTGSGSPQYHLVWVDRSGKAQDSMGALALYQSPAISPDGKRIAVHRHDGTGGDVWIVEEASGKMSRLTFDASQDNSQPIWSADGSRIVFGSRRNGKWGMYQKLSNGTGGEELLFESDAVKMPMSWSGAINTILFYVSDPKNANDVWALPLTGDRKPFPVLQTSFAEAHPQISPDGKWLAYTSNETGINQVYVQSFPPGHGKWQISNNGGQFSRWRADGKELFYMERGSYGKIMVVAVHATASTFEFSEPRPLFDSGYLNNAPGHTGNYNTFDVSADGQRFLIPRPDPANSDALASSPITVVLNWATAINKK